jgi:transcriptional regulator with PAS, ATPase and Fis domain
MKLDSDKVIEQLKPILNALTSPAALLDARYNVLWRSGTLCSELPSNMRRCIEIPPESAGSEFIVSDIIIYKEERRLSGKLIQFGEYYAVLFSDPYFTPKDDSPAVKQQDPSAGDINIVYSSEAMKATIDLAHRSSDIDATILLNGETGVGKTVLAKYIHNLSPRKNAPFISINCGAIPVALLESELFGYEKGAFTGADKAGKVGLFEAAAGGTVFLDEIGEISKDIQVKILHAIEERKIIRVGGRHSVHLDIRFIAATNKDLARMVRDGDFREDLYYRLNVISFAIPPLRDRREDIEDLVHYYLKVNNRKYNLNKEIDADVMRILKGYDWPGNVRELQNSVERMLVMSPTDLITAKDLPSNIFSPVSSEAFHHASAGNGSLQDEKDMLEREMIQRALSECKSIRKAATRLGISHVTLLRKLDKLNMRPNAAGGSGAGGGNMEEA